MADSGGHWKDLAEAQKLTMSTRIPGVFEEDVKLNNPLERLPVAQSAHTGLKIEWLREKTTTEDAVTELGIGDDVVWSKDTDYTAVESTLRRIYIARKLDHYLPNIYGTFNDYEAQVLLECEKGLKRKVGDRLIYGDETYGASPTQFDGLHALAAERGTPYSSSALTASPLNIDNGEAGLSLQYLRVLLNAMKHGVDEIWVSEQVGIRLDAAYEEKGFAGLKYDTAGALALLTRGMDSIGKPMLFFAGLPIVRTGFLVAEQANTGTGASSNARAKRTSGDNQYSLFCIKRGNPLAKEPGICYGYGGTEGQGDFYKLRVVPDLENADAEGMKLFNYGSVLLGSTLCLGRIFDIEDAAVTV